MPGLNKNIIYIFYLLLTAPLAHAGHWYLGGMGGVAYVPGNASAVGDDGLSRTNAQYGTGYNGAVALGYESGPIRYEVDMTYLRAPLDHFDLNSVEQTETDGNSAAIANMLNLYYDFNHTQAFNPYLGVGLGYIFASADLNSTEPTESSFEGSNHEFAYQAKGGLRYKLNPHLGINFEYTYLSSTTSINELGEHFQAHLGSLGVSYHFDEI